MLKVINLDNQTFEEIMQEALAQVAHVYPEWTDYNAHDPGVTLLELFAWYKEMQQYHLNAPTLQVLDMYLKLMGFMRSDVFPAKAIVKFSNVDVPFDIKKGDYIDFGDGNYYEFLNRKTIGKVNVEKIAIKENSKIFDVTEYIQVNKMNFDVFGKGQSVMYVKLDGVNASDKQISLYIDVYDGYSVKRNPFLPEQILGRNVGWYSSKGKELSLKKDDTHSLSTSGEIIFDNIDYKESDPVGLGKGFWILAKLNRVGCEEIPEICGISASYTTLTKQKTLVSSHYYTLNSHLADIKMDTNLIKDKSAMVFGRDKYGYIDIEGIEISEDIIKIRSKTPFINDGKPNVVIILYSNWVEGYVTADGSGKGDFLWNLPLQSKIPNAPEIKVLGKCETEKGVRYKEWSYIQEIKFADKYSRCFSYDYSKEGLIFGDNIYGEVAPKGNNSLVLMNLSLVESGGIHIPSEKILIGKDCYVNMEISDAKDLEMPETTLEAKSKLSSMLAYPCKAITQSDYCFLAKKTPGLRVARAKAIYNFDADSMMDYESENVVTLIVVPYSKQPNPIPDNIFLKTVADHMEKYRPICKMLKVRAPNYLSIDINAKIISKAYDKNVYELIKKSISDILMYKDNVWRLGDVISESEIMGAIGSVNQVLGVSKIMVSLKSSRITRNDANDVILPKNSQAILDKLYIVNV